MTRLIDADELLKAYEGRNNFLGAVLVEAPTIDAVPVVRCKDCKHGIEDDGEIECTFWDFMGHTHHNTPNMFCSRAERKEE